MSFGFSIGDFIAFINLIKDVTQALDASTGSASEVRSISRVIESISQAVLGSEVVSQQWERLEVAPEFKAIASVMISQSRTERDNCTSILKEVKDSLKPYTDALVIGSRSSIIRQTKKLTWLFRKDDAAQFERRIDGHLKALQISMTTLSQLHAACNAHTAQGILSGIAGLTAQINMIALAVDNQSQIPKGLGYQWEANPADHIILLDAVGRPVRLPMMLTTSPRDVHEVLTVMYRNRHGQQKIIRKEYNLTDEDADGLLLDESNWIKRIHSGMQISMNMIFPAPPSLSIERCPQCNQPCVGGSLSGQRARCHKCQLTFRIFEKERIVEVAESPGSDPSNLETPEDGESTLRAATTASISDPKTSMKGRHSEDLMFKNVHYHREIKISKNSLATHSASRAPPKEHSIDDLPPLHKAAATGAIAEIDRLVDQGVDVNSPLEQHTVVTGRFTYSNFRLTSCSPLHIASYYGQIKAVKRLLERGANILAHDIDEAQPLVYAIWGKNPQRVFHPLIAAGADINARDKFGRTPFHDACKVGPAWAVHYFLAQGVNIEDQNAEGMTPIGFSIWGNQKEIFDILLDEGAEPLLFKDPEGWGALHYAAGSNCLEIAESLLDLGADPLAGGNNKATALHEACEQGYLSIVRLLLDRGADITGTCSSSFHPIHFAARTGNVPTLELLISRGAAIHARNKFGEDALLLAIAKNHLPAVKFLLQHGANANTSSASGLTALIFASSDERLEMISLLLEHGAEVDTQNSLGETALLIAALLGRLDIVSLLLQHKASISVTTQDGLSPLMAAALSGSYDIVMLLLKADADVNLLAGDGSTALSLAMEAENHEMAFKILSRLLENGADLLLDREVLSKAARAGHTAVIELLLSRGLNIDFQTTAGRTALHRACFGGHTSTVQLLLDRGARFLQDIQGRVPLHEAAYNGNEETVKLLLEYKADPNATTPDGDTVIKWAAIRHNLGAMRLLVEAGAQLNTRDKDGQSPLHNACSKGGLDTISFLLDHGCDPTLHDDNGNTIFDYGNCGLVDEPLLVFLVGYFLDFMVEEGPEAASHLFKDGKELVKSLLGRAIKDESESEVSVLSATPTISQSQLERFATF